LTGALSAITASVVGVILNLAVWFALHTWFRDGHVVTAFGFHFDAPSLGSIDPWALLLSCAAMTAIFLFRTAMVPTLLACATAGILLHLALGVV
jgi:chromate transporter